MFEHRVRNNKIKNQYSSMKHMEEIHLLDILHKCYPKSQSNKKNCIIFAGGLNEDELKAFDKNLMPYLQPIAVRSIPAEIFQVRASLVKK